MPSGDPPLVLMAFCTPSLWSPGYPGLHKSCSGRGLVNVASGEKVRARCSCWCHNQNSGNAPRALPQHATLAATVSGWPTESLDAQHRFGSSHAKLFPFIDKRVRTPNGYGRLFTVFAECVEVAMEKTGKIGVFSPRDVVPAQEELAAGAQASASLTMPSILSSGPTVTPRRSSPPHAMKGRKHGN